MNNRSTHCLYLLVFLSGMLSSWDGFSQVRGAFKVGLSTSSLLVREEALGRSKPLMGYQGGFFFTGPIHPRFVLQGEVMLNKTGWRISGLPENGSMHLHYMRFPLMLGYKPHSRVTMLGGGGISLLVSALYQPFNSGSMIRYTSFFPLLDYNFQAGVTYKMGSNLSLELRALQSLKPLYSSVSEKTYAGQPVQRPIKDGCLQSFQLSMIYHLPYRYDY